MQALDRIKRISGVGILALLAIGTGGCDGNEVVSIIDKPLDQNETAQLLDVVGQVTFSIPGSSGQPCPRGGTIQLGSVETTTGTGTGGEDLVFHSATLTLVDCEGLSESGIPFELDGDVDTTITLVTDDGVPVSFSGEHTGSFDWSIGARTGSCTLDLDTGPSITGATTIPVEGTLCSRSVSTSVEIE